MFAMSGKELAKQVERRVGQGVLTCPTTAVYAGLDEGEPIPLGKTLRFFGDGWQISKVIGGVRYWRVPVMDGEFVAQETTPVVKGVGGGNLLILARDTDAALAAATRAVAAMREVPGVIMPFPGGVVRSGSKVGSKYSMLPASTNDAFCPGLLGLASSSALTPEVRCVLEIVIDGLTEAAVADAMRAGLSSLIEAGAASGVIGVTAGNYGGKLGPFHFHLHKLLPAGAGVSPAAHDAPWRPFAEPQTQPPALRVDMRGILPAALADMSAAQVERLPVLHGNERLALADLFSLSSAPSDTPALVFEGDLSRFDRIGWQLGAGRIELRGPAGNHLGTGMSGGEILVSGRVGHMAGCEMSGGRLHIAGDVGDFAASALPGSMNGMSGGTLVVEGNAGERFGDRMRRGTAVIHGDAGDFLCSRMVAGTVAVAGRIGAHCAWGMRRGSIVCVGSPPALAPTFVANAADITSFWALLARDLAGLGGPFAALDAVSDRTTRRRSGRWRHGGSVAGGLGPCCRATCGGEGGLKWALRALIEPSRWPMLIRLSAMTPKPTQPRRHSSRYKQ